MEQYKDSWLMKVKQELNELGLCYIWNLPNVDTIVIKERIYDTFKLQCYNRIMTTPKGIRSEM